MLIYAYFCVKVMAVEVSQNNVFGEMVVTQGKDFAIAAQKL